MKRTLCLVIGIAASLALAQKDIAKPVKGPPPLPSKTKPFSLPPFLKDKDILVAAPGVQSAKEVMRIFYYSWQEPFADASKRAKSLLTTKDGWKVLLSRIDMIVYERVPKTGKVRRQVVSIKGEKATLTGSGLESKSNPRWTYVAYNEGIASKRK